MALQLQAWTHVALRNEIGRAGMLLFCHPENAGSQLCVAQLLSVVLLVGQFVVCVVTVACYCLASLAGLDLGMDWNTGACTHSEEQGLTTCSMVDQALHSSRRSSRCCS